MITAEGKIFEKGYAGKHFFEDIFLPYQLEMLKGIETVHPKF